MAYIVAWSLNATEDLEAILTYLQRDSPRYASNLLDDLLSRARSLTEHPHRGRIVPEVDDDSLREIFVDQCRMIYYIENERIKIVSVVHASRDLIQFWREHS